jgi:hypothetical protein
MKLGHGVIASALVSAGLLVAACGSSSAPAGSKTAAQIVPAMETAIKAASSVHTSGTVVQGSQKISIDVSLNGTDISGTISDGSKSFTIVVSDGKAYVQITQSYLKSAGIPVADCSSLCGKYVQSPASEAAEFAPFTMSSLMNEIVKDLPSAAGDTTDMFEPATFKGQPVLRFSQGGSTVDVARTGAPYLLFISSTAQGSAQGSLTFSEWNSVPAVTPPAPSQIIQA